MKYTLKCLFILICFSSKAQVTLNITSLPVNTPNGAVIYFASSVNSWSPNNNNFVLNNGNNGTKTITIPEGTGTVQFKFTRGSWASVETNSSGGAIANRTFTFTGQPQTINLTVQNWEDLATGGGISTAASNVQIWNASFFMPQLNRNRRIWLYLPPDYNTTTKTYPVIYMQDGQNLFDNLTSFSGEWQVDETLNLLHQNGDYGAIVVGIDNGGAFRTNEYAPWANAVNGGGQGDLYLDFIVQTLKPAIDSQFRTKPQANFTALIGSSLGALISTYGQVKFTNTFHKIGSFSPAYWFNLPDLNQYIQNTTSNLVNSRVYFVAGQNESTTMASNIVTIRNLLQSKGQTVANTLTKIDSYGTHTEAYWRGEFAAAYQWLFATTNLNVANPIQKERVLYQTSKNNIFAKNIDTSQFFDLYQINGQFIKKIKINEGLNELNLNLSSGIYFLKSGDLKLKIYQ